MLKQDNWGREYLGIYAFAESTLLAVTQTLDMPLNDDVFKAVIGLSSYSGGCGGLCGVIADLGLRFGIDPTAYRENPDTTPIRKAVKQFRDKFVSEYGGYLCCDIQTKFFGRCYDSFDPKDMEQFMELNPTETCKKVTKNATEWAVEVIFETEANANR